jgi:hypothetical protein
MPNNMKNGYYAEVEYQHKGSKLTQPASNLYGETLKELNLRITDFKRDCNINMFVWRPTVLGVFKVTKLKYHG